MDIKKIKVAFQGEPGAYSEEAAFLYFGNFIETVGCKTLSDVFQILEKDKVDYAIVPVENSLEGTVGGTYDLFLKYNLKPDGEVLHRIRHCLISFPRKNLKSLKRVYSHPQALGQCKEFLEKHRYEAIPVYDTAGSVKIIKEKRLKNSAGIASERAAKLYGMKIIKKGIETNLQNFTRFLILFKKETKPTGNDKTSLIFSTKHVPGALYRALMAFAVRKINLTKIESRPIIGRPWEYNFILDFEGHQEDKKIRETLKDLKKSKTFLKIIGSYPKAK